MKIEARGVGPVDVRFTERGGGRPVLLLHGGGGPRSVVPWGELLASSAGARVITPTHPGLAGTPRPSGLKSIGSLAEVYSALIDELGLDEVVVAGHSVGGWIASELALVAGARVSSLILVDAVGIDVPEHPAADVFGGEPTTEDWRVLKMYAGRMMDPSLRARLASASEVPPTLVVWGERDGVVDSEYGRAYAEAIAGAEFKLLEGVGHSPQIEAPKLLLEAVRRFIASHDRRRSM